MKVLEHYTSVQGEGSRTGLLTQFVRFAGCNLRCPGWPCDTPQAIFPAQYAGLYSKENPKSLFDQINIESSLHGAQNICFTGGEPFMQPESELVEIVKTLARNDYTVEFFTNGTYLLESWVHEYCQIMMDWKLTGSGEDMSKHEHIRRHNARNLTPVDGIKFVCKNIDDMYEGLSVADDIQLEGGKARFWIGTAWSELSEQDVVEFMKEHGLSSWRLNVQTHKYIWSPEKRFV